MEIVTHHRCDRARGCELHPIGDLLGAAVEEAAEKPRKAEHVVDLIRVVAPSGSDHGCDALDGLGLHLRLGIRQREDDRSWRHAAYEHRVEYPADTRADEDVGAVERFAQAAAKAPAVGGGRIRFLSIVHSRSVVAVEHYPDN